MSPLVSVIMPTFCRGNNGLLRRAINCVLNQVFRDFEFIIIDDGSRDSTRQVIASYNDPRIRYVRHEDNCGIPARRENEGIRLARGEYIAFMFDDDVWLPYHLEAAVQHLRKLSPEFGAVFGLVKTVNVQSGREELLGANYSPERLHQHNCVGNLAIVVRKPVLLRVGGFDEDPSIRRYCDWDLWLRIVKIGYKLYKIPEVTSINYHNHRDSISVNIPVDERQVRVRMAQDRSYQLRSLVWPYDARYLLTPEARAKYQLVRGSVRPAVYMLADGFKHVFPSRQVFESLKFSWDAVKILPQNVVDNIPDGLIIN